MKAAKKLSGPSLNRFFRRFYQSQPGLDPQTAEQLTTISVRTFSSVRIRRIAWRQVHTSTAVRRPAKPGTGVAPAQPETIKSKPVETPAVQTGAADQTPTKTFDPYSFGLVPIYQREGREGLLTKLATVETPDNLRKMAKAQQIALPADLRNGDIAVDTLREAIAAAVEKRIANRRAAAG